jgi:hypothetical protein
VHLEHQQNSVVVDNQAQQAQADDNGVKNTALLALFSFDLIGLKQEWTLVPSNRGHDAV